MNKPELINIIATKTAQNKTVVARMADALLETIEETLASGGEVNLSGFGKFHVSQRDARVGRNPRTGASVDIPASRSPKFSAGKGLKNALNT